MLCDCGGFSVDELESVLKALAEHSSDEDAMANAADAAIKDYIENLSDELDSIDSIEELERHQQRVGDLVNNYGPPDTALRSSMKACFESRYESLSENEHRDDDYEGYGSRGNLEPQISNQQIRSMFGELS